MYSHHTTVLDGTSMPSENIGLSDDESILSLDSDLGNNSNPSYIGEIPKSTKDETKLMQELSIWITNHNITHTAVCDLINILSKYEYPNVSELSNSNSRVAFKRGASTIMEYDSPNNKVPSTSKTIDITTRLDTVEQKIDMHQIATQKVLSNQATMQQMLKLILQKLPPEQQIPISDINVDVENTDLLPITSIDMLEDYESRLSNFPDFKNKIINVLSQYGGSDARKTSRNIVRAMITDEVLINFSWTGTNTKRVFSCFREINSTIITTMRKKFHNYTEYENATFFKEYLKHASTRLYRHDNKSLEFKLKQKCFPLEYEHKTHATN